MSVSFLAKLMEPRQKRFPSGFTKFCSGEVRSYVIIKVKYLSKFRKRELSSKYKPSNLLSVCVC